MLFIRLFMYVGSPSSSFVSRWEASAVWNASKSCIHSTAKSWGWTSVLLKTRINGSLVLYRMLDRSTFHRSPCDMEANRSPPASVEHIGHESRGSHRSGGVNDINHNGGEAGSHGVCYDGSRCRPGKNLNLSRSVQNHITRGRTVSVFWEDAVTTAEVLDGIRPFLDKAKDLVKLSCEQVESGENAAIRPQVVPFSMLCYETGRGRTMVKLTVS